MYQFGSIKLLIQPTVFKSITVTRVYLHCMKEISNVSILAQSTLIYRADQSLIKDLRPVCGLGGDLYDIAQPKD